MAASDLPTPRDLQALLEDERASVEIEVALFNGATELSEREAFAGMGALEVNFCVALRTELEGHEGGVTPHINGVVLDILNLERYDERLSAFADHQLRVASAIPALAATVPVGDLHALLRDIEDAHLRSAAWSRRRATAFAATRLLLFHGEGDPALGDPANAASGANGARHAPLPEA
jgi:hypothetical protein